MHWLKHMSSNRIRKESTFDNSAHMRKSRKSVFVCQMARICENCTFVYGWTNRENIAQQAKRAVCFVSSAWDQMHHNSSWVRNRKRLLIQLFLSAQFWSRSFVHCCNCHCCSTLPFGWCAIYICSVALSSSTTPRIYSCLLLLLLRTRMSYVAFSILEAKPSSRYQKQGLFDFIASEFDMSEWRWKAKRNSLNAIESRRIDRMLCVCATLQQT